MKKKLPQTVRQVEKNQLEDIKGKTRVSFSELSTYTTCPRQWELRYLRKKVEFKPTIHLVFGTAVHETIQHWLDVMFKETVKKANTIDLHKHLYKTLFEEYKKRMEKEKDHFSTPEELYQFYIEGCHILDFLKKKRGEFFSRRSMHLAGIETRLQQEIRPGVYFKGFIDLVFYNKIADSWTILDIKTSTSGWNSYAKKDFTKKAQLLLYKKFFSQQFDIPIEKIDVEFFIVKRQVPKDAEFAVMQRRVQEFKVPSGKINVGRATKILDSFLDEVYKNSDTPEDKKYPAKPSKWNCRFCDLRNSELCKESYYNNNNDGE